jgi:ribosomal protein L37AE/L43A
VKRAPGGQVPLFEPRESTAYAKPTPEEVADFNARLREGMRESVARRNATVLPDSRPTCPNCHGICSPGYRVKVRGVWWCKPCSRGLATALKNHCTGTAERIADLKAEQRRAQAVPQEEAAVPPDGRDRAAAEERAAIVTFLQDITRRPPPNVDHSDAYRRLWLISESIEREALSPAQAFARIRDIARTTGEPLSTVLFTAAKGIERGKHRPTAVAEPSDAHLRAGSGLTAPRPNVLRLHGVEFPSETPEQAARDRAIDEKARREAAEDEAEAERERARAIAAYGLREATHADLAPGVRLAQLFWNAARSAMEPVYVPITQVDDDGAFQVPHPLDGQPWISGLPGDGWFVRAEVAARPARRGAIVAALSRLPSAAAYEHDERGARRARLAHLLKE